MGQKYEKRSREQITSVMESLRESADLLQSVVARMEQAKMDEAYFAWTERQWLSLDLVAALAAHCAQAIIPQATAKQQGRPSIYEVAKTRSARDMAKRAERKAAEAAASGTTVPKRPRGRPRKNG